jgi:hypothetical protein
MGSGSMAKVKQERLQQVIFLLGMSLQEKELTAPIWLKLQAQNLNKQKLVIQEIHRHKFQMF